MPAGLSRARTRRSADHRHRDGCSRAAYARPGAARRTVSADLRRARRGDGDRARPAHRARHARDVWRRAPGTDTRASSGCSGHTPSRERLRRVQRLVRRATACDGVAVPFLADDDAPGIVAAFRELPVSGWHVHGAELQTDGRPGAGRSRIERRAPGQGQRHRRAPADGALVGHWVESPAEQYDLWRSAMSS